MIHQSKKDAREQGKRLKQARIKAGWRFAIDFAEALGLPVATYTQHEKNGAFRAAAAKVYATAFNVSPGWLMFGEGDPPSPRQYRFQVAHELGKAQQSCGS
jgi:transcriptional regulator with XRE-family HTH domain